MSKRIYILSFLECMMVFSTLKAQTTLVGMTSRGGAYGMGTVFSIIPGDTTLLHHHSLYSATPGSQPEYTHLTQASNGKLYGMTSFGGIHNKGVIFEYSYTTNTYTRLYDFNGINGGFPHGSLTEVTPGKLYGMARGNGISSDGVIFEYDYINNTYSKKFDMTTNSGVSPFGTLIKASNNKLYGMNYGWGAFGKGTIFEFDYLSGIFTKKVDFDGANGAGGLSALTEASNGKLYGMTLNGGPSNEGVIFEFDYVSGAYTKLFDFGGNNGVNPFGSLLEASNGKLYGLTYEGGWYNKGVLFEYDYASNTFTKKQDLQLPTGGNPHGSLIEVNGLLYGVTSEGGTNGKGVLFEYDVVSNIYTVKANLSGGNGNSPRGSLVEAGNGKLYGLTYAGGAFGKGVIFEFNISTNSYIRKISLNSSDGSMPKGSLMQTTNGKLFGMTSEGGTSNKGAIFEFDLDSGIYTKRLDITGCSGDTPYSSLIQAPNGKFYGVTINGGTYDEGIFFEYDSVANICIKLNDFWFSEGRNPYGTPTLAANGKIYGTSINGGATAGCGVIYEHNYVTGTYTKKMNLVGGQGGCHSFSSLAEANGKLYGMTNYGGLYSDGVIFEYDYNTNTYQKKKDFDNTNGALPHGSLIKASNNKLYGMATYGGLYGDGVIFEYDYTSNVLIKLVDFDGMNGKFPFGSLMQASNGKLYGMTKEGGAYNQGVVFEYDYSSYTLTTKLNLSDTIGSYPEYGHLIEVNLTPLSLNNFSHEFKPLIYPNPAGDKVTVEFTSNKNIDLMTISFTDISGREILSNEHAATSGLNRFEFDISACKAGLYLLHITDKEGNWSVHKIAVK